MVLAHRNLSPDLLAEYDRATCTAGGWRAALRMLKFLLNSKSSEAVFNELMEYVILQRFLESMFEPHTLYSLCLNTESARNSSDGSTDADDGDDEDDEEDDLMVRPAASALHQISRIPVFCVTCRAQFDNRRCMWLCPNCLLATCCEKCAPITHDNPDLCAQVYNNYLRCALSRTTFCFGIP
jgi:hypothetical protein